MNQSSSQSPPPYNIIYLYLYLSLFTLHSHSIKMATMPSPPPPSSPLLPLQHRVAIVTGASRGIGRAIALHFASLGAKLLINYVSNSAQALLLASQINSSFPGAALTLQGDVSDPATVAALFDKAEHAFNSPVHILVNSAAIIDPHKRNLADLPLEDFDRILRQLPPIYLLFLFFFFLFIYIYIYFFLQRECKRIVSVRAGGCEQSEARGRRADYTDFVVLGWGSEAWFGGLHGIEGGGGDDDDDTGEGDEREWNYSELCVAGADCDGDVSDGEERGGGEESGGRVPNGAGGGGHGCGSIGGVFGFRFGGMG